MPFDISLLNDVVPIEQKGLTSDQVTADLKRFFSLYGINVRIISVKTNNYSYIIEIKPPIGVRMNKIMSLNDEAKLFFGCEVKIDRSGGNKNTISIIVYTSHPIWSLKEALQSEKYEKTQSPLMIPVGLKATGDVLLLDLE